MLLKKFLSKRKFALAKSFFLLFSSTLLVLFFQNCGRGFDNLEHIESVSKNDTENTLDVALRTGQASLVTDEEIYLQEILNLISKGKGKYTPAYNKLLNLGVGGTIQSNSLTQISWDPSHDSAALQPQFPLNTTLLMSNKQSSSGASKTVPLAIIGQMNNSRYQVLGSNPFRKKNNLNENMNELMENSFSWLINRDDLKTKPFNVVIAHMDQSQYFPDETGVREWLDEHYSGNASYNTANSCDGSLLEQCLLNTSLLIVSQISDSQIQAASTAAIIKQAMANGLPVMYLHHDGDLKYLGKELFKILNVTYSQDNYWLKPTIEKYDPTILVGKAPDHIEKSNNMFKSFLNNTFDIDLTLCDDKSCPPESNFEKSFNHAATEIKNIIDKFDENKLNIFKQENLKLEKLWVLLADYWRQKSVFPMDKTNDKYTFLKSLYADHVIHIRRDINPAQKDMGTYSRSDFTHIIPENKTLAIASKSNFRATSIYALPGQTFRVTRLDKTPVKVSIRINSLRHGANHIYNKDSYDQPFFAGASTKIPLESGEIISLTSPFGGPIHTYFDQKGHSVFLRFENIGSHPFWNGPEDNDQFLSALDKKEYDWAEFVTPHFEIHSNIDKMTTTVNNALVNKDLQSLASLITDYHHGYARAIAGFKGDDIPEMPDVINFAITNNIEMPTWDTIQHFNADRATCGSGCSGNPYDAYWGFSPLGHGDLHEVGHNMESSTLRWSEWEGHASTNWYSYYPKFMFHNNTNQDSSCQSLPYTSLYQDLQKSREQSDPNAYMHSLDYKNWQKGAAIMIQTMAAAEHERVLREGWMFLARMHLIKREFNIADNSPLEWSIRAARIGFGGMLLDTAKALSHDEWWLIAASHATGRNMTDFMEMWGAQLSDNAKSIVAKENYPNMPTTFYQMAEKDHCYKKLIESSPLPIGEI